MPRKPRFAPPGHYLHLTQRGNYRQTTFHCDLDHRVFQQLLAKHADANKVQLLAYCQMSNHYHLVARSLESGGISAFMRGVNGQYSRYLHSRLVLRGRLWQDRYHSCLLSTAHLILAMRYVELNPVRARLVSTAVQYPWSSARIHSGTAIARPTFMDDETFSELYPVREWRDFLLAGEQREEEVSLMRYATRYGYPLEIAS